ncbi:MAG TPA: M28 family metallopeptidase [bacterium]|nr:M28 family metallopeptidase [bacterium]
MMRRCSRIGFGRAAAGALAAVLALPLASPGAVPTPAAVEEVLSQVSGPRAYGHVLELSQKIGPHVAGSRQDRPAGAYIAGQLEKDGYGVEWQPFQFPFFGVRAIALSVPSAPAVVLHPNVMVYSPSTVDGGITAQVVDIGLGGLDDVRAKPPVGKIALILRGGMTFAEKVKNAGDAGALAAIIYNAQAGDLRGVVGRGAKIPAVSLSGVDGERLLTLVRAGPLTVHLNVQTVDEQRTTWNIIATKPGTRDAHRVVVVGAHRDTVEGAPGANDNTSGVATALEVAEVLRGVPLALTVRFVFFGEEEYGLYGSEYYVHHMGADPVVGMVDLDMEGVGEKLQLARDKGSDELVHTAAAVAERLGIKVTVQPSGGSDHQSFEAVGVPTVFILRPDDPYYDTPKDTVDRVDPNLLAVSARLATAVVLDVAGAGR